MQVLQAVADDGHRVGRSWMARRVTVVVSGYGSLAAVIVMMVFAAAVVLICDGCSTQIPTSMKI